MYVFSRHPLCRNYLSISTLLIALFTAFTRLRVCFACAGRRSKVGAVEYLTDLLQMKSVYWFVSTWLPLSHLPGTNTHSWIPKIHWVMLKSVSVDVCTFVPACGNMRILQTTMLKRRYLKWQCVYKWICGSAFIFKDLWALNKIQSRPVCVSAY